MFSFRSAIALLAALLAALFGAVVYRAPIMLL